MRISKIGRRIAPGLCALAAGAALLPTVSQAATKAPTPSRPSVSTGIVSHVVGTTAQLEGSINPRMLATTYFFQYGPTTAYGAQTPTASLAAGTLTVKVAQTVTGLLPGYHYRLVATNSVGRKEGKDRTFTVKTKKKKTAFTLPKSFEPTIYGGTFILRGTLTGTGNVNRSIVLQASPYPYRAAFVTVGTPIATGAGGVFAFRVAHVTSSTKYRISTVAAPATPTVLSPIVTEQVAARVTLKVRSSARKGLVRLYGTVTPAAVGSRVYFELEKTIKPKPEKPSKPERPGKTEKSEKEKPPGFSPKFSTTVKAATRTFSRFSLVVNIRAAGRYRALVDIRTGSVISGHSSGITLHAAPTVTKKGKTKKKKKA